MYFAGLGGKQGWFQMVLDSDGRHYISIFSGLPDTWSTAPLVVGSRCTSSIQYFNMELRKFQWALYAYHMSRSKVVPTTVYVKTHCIICVSLRISFFGSQASTNASARLFLHSHWRGVFCMQRTLHCICSLNWKDSWGTSFNEGGKKCKWYFVISQIAT